MEIPRPDQSANLSARPNVNLSVRPNVSLRVRPNVSLSARRPDFPKASIVSALRATTLNRTPLAGRAGWARKAVALAGGRTAKDVGAAVVAALAVRVVGAVAGSGAGRLLGGGLTQTDNEL